MPGPYQYDDSYERRRDALELAIKFIKDDYDSGFLHSDEDTISVAKTFLNFLLKEK